MPFPVPPPLRADIVMGDVRPVGGGVGVLLPLLPALALPWLPPPVDRAAVTAVPLVAGVSSIMGAAPAVAVAADIYYFSPGRIWKIGLPGSRIDFFQCFCSAFAICKVFGQRTLRHRDTV